MADHPSFIEHPELFRPGTFGCHEALHMAHVLADMVFVRLCDHPAIQLREDWALLAEEARRALAELYLTISEEHVDGG